MHEYDKSSKWLIQHYGDSILRLAGVRGIVSWKALQAELVQSRRLPDGLIKAKLRQQAKPARFVLETISWFARHRFSDADGAAMSDEVAEETVVDGLVHALRP